MEKICTCGDTEMQHIDGCEQCVVSDCGCREFSEDEIDDAIEEAMIEVSNLPKGYDGMDL